MALKLFLKHLFTSIKRRPAQPVLLVIIIALSVMVCICAMDLEDYLREEDLLVGEQKIGNADVSISVNSLSSTRFITEEEVREVLPSGTKICGTYGIPMFFGEEHTFIYGVASRLTSINDIYDITFIESEPIPDTKISQSCVVAQKFAVENGLEMGATISVEVLGVKKDLTIYALSEHALLGEYDLLMDISAITEPLAKESFFIGMQKDSFFPTSQILISSNGKEGQIMRILSQKFPDMTISYVTATINAEYDELSSVIELIVVFAVLLVLVTIYCCFHILATQRYEENLLFYGVGVRKKVLNFLSMFEMFLYWLVGGMVGTFLSYPMSMLIIKSADLSYVVPYFHLPSIAMSLFIVLVASEISLLMFYVADWFKKVKKSKVEKSEKVKLVTSLVLFGAITVFAVITWFVKLPLKKYFGLFGIVCLVFFIFIFGKFSFQKIAEGLSKKRSIPIPILYGNKNAKNVVPLSNTAGLASLFFVLITMLVFLMCYSEAQVRCYQEYFAGDYVVINADQNTREKINGIEGVDRAYSIYRDYCVALDNDMTILAVSANDVNAFGKKANISDLPKGKEAYVTGLYAQKFELEIGDTFLIELEGRTLELVYTKPVQANMAVFIFDAKEFDIPLSYTTVVGQEGYDKEKLYENIMTDLSFDAVTVMKREDINRNVCVATEQYLLCAYIVVAYIIIFALIGMIDSIISGYRFRKEEFDCYHYSGMGKNDVLKMKIWETIFAFLFGIILSILCIGIMFYFSYEVGIGLRVDFLVGW